MLDLTSSTKVLLHYLYAIGTGRFVYVLMCQGHSGGTYRDGSEDWIVGVSLDPGIMNNLIGNFCKN